MKPHPRPPISPRLSARLRRLSDALAGVWAEWEACECDMHSEHGRVLLTRAHDLHWAIAETMAAIEMHKRRRRGY